MLAASTADSQMANANETSADNMDVMGNLLPALIEVCMSITSSKPYKHDNTVSLSQNHIRMITQYSNHLDSLLYASRLPRPSP